MTATLDGPWLDQPRTDAHSHTAPATGAPGQHDVTWDTARQLAHAAAPLSPRRVPLAEAAGATLAGPLLALRCSPAFDASAMDGYAVAGLPPWHQVGRLEAGQAWPAPLAAGTAVEIATGAPLPVGARGVLRYEDAAVVNGLVTGDPGRASHVRATGSDVRTGQEILPAGAALTPAALGLAAAAGHDDLLVRPRPRVYVIVTGRELTGHGPGGGAAVRDALTPLLVPLIGRLGGEVAGVARTDDDGLPAHWEQDRHGADVVVTTGSTSRGMTDRLPALARSAGIVFHGVRCRPGHPQLLAGGAAGPWLVGLPGNPFAAFTAAWTTLAPLFAGLTGRPLSVLPRICLAGEQPGPRPGTTRLVPVRWTDDGPCLLAGASSAFLGNAARQHALAVFGPNWRPGDPCRLLLTDIP